METWQLYCDAALKKSSLPTVYHYRLLMTALLI